MHFQKAERRSSSLGSSWSATASSAISGDGLLLPWSVNKNKSLSNNWYSTASPYGGDRATSSGLNSGASDRGKDTSDITSAVECEQCGKLFHGINKKFLLNRHKITHTNEKPYECPYCPYRANVSSNLSRHIKTVHSSQAGSVSNNYSVCVEQHQYNEAENLVDMTALKSPKGNTYF